MANSGEPLHVPEDITSDILLRLPVESLLRCQCVCKSWRDLIQSAQFVQSHTNDVNRRRTRAIFFKNMRLPDLSPKKFFAFHVEEHESDKLKKMKLFETMHMRGIYRIHGHCNGIICISRIYSDTYYDSYDDGDGVPDILLWNPTLRQCRALPPTRILSGKHLNRFGFGYDSTNQDYKAVNLPIYGMSAMYSFKSNSWKPVQCDHLWFLEYEKFANSSRGCLFKGRLHWIVDCDPPVSKMFLVVFDLNEEIFTEFGIPESLYKNHRNELGHNLGVFRGRLSLLLRNLNEEYEIWSLKDESWTRTCNFSSEGICVHRFQTFPGHELGFLELTEDGKVLMRFDDYSSPYGGGSDLLYDVEMNRLEVGKKVWLFRSSHITNFLETLVSVMPETTMATKPSGRQNCSDPTPADSYLFMTPGTGPM